MKTGDLTKALVFILPLTERLTNPLFPDFKESRIRDAVFHYFHRSQIWLFHLVEALPNNHWSKTHQKQVTLPTAAEPTLDAKWLWQRDCRHEPSRAVPCLMHQVSQTSGGLSMHLSPSWVGFGLLDSLIWEHVDYLAKVPWLGCFYCCFSSPCWLCSLNVSRECFWEGGNRGHQWSGDVLNADTINKSLIVKI